MAGRGVQYAQPQYAPLDATHQFTSETEFKRYSDTPSYEQAYNAYGSGEPVRRGARAAKPGHGKRIIVGTVIAVIALAIVGGVVGAVVAVTRNKSNKSTSSQSNNAAAAAPSASADPGKVSGGSTSGSGDASFTLDSRLKKSFWAMAYTPPNAAYYPGCGDTIEAIVKDIQIISQLTTRIRLYGADCNQSAFVLDAIQRTKTNLSVYLGVYMDINDPTIYQRQVKTTMDVLNQFKPTNVLGITVGNEILLQASSAGVSVANAQADVIANINSVKSSLRSMNLNIPVGSGDAGSMITRDYAAATDFLFSNNHPFFSGVTINDAAGWTYNYMNTDSPSVAKGVTPLLQGEVGWPTNADPGGSLSLNGSAATLANSQTFLDTWVCQSNANQTQYVYFEAFDEAWKSIYNGSEPYWGLFDKNRVFKALTIPDCPANY